MMDSFPSSFQKLGYRAIFVEGFKELDLCCSACREKGYSEFAFSQNLYALKLEA